MAYDIVKLDDVSVSNCSNYTFYQRSDYNASEHERFILNKNYRVNMADLEPNELVSFDLYQDEYDWPDYGKICQKGDVDKVYQGVQLSDTLLGYFQKVYESAFDENGRLVVGEDEVREIYVPTTNPNDFKVDVALIANNRPDFPSSISRKHYDERHQKYKDLLAKFGIDFVSTFALVDSKDFKNHTGEWLVKVQRKYGERYGYIVARIGFDGKIATKDDGTLDLRVFSSPYNTILSVCENDYAVDRITWKSDKIWNAVERDVPMVKSTTSSQYSIFEQYIPDADLANVRQYLQFRTRLRGMDVCMEQLDQMVHAKEVMCSERFAKMTFSIQTMFNEIKKNKGVIDLVIKYYGQIEKYDSLYTKRIQLVSVVDEKRELLDQLLAEYNKVPGTEMERKMELGQRIKSLRLELNKSLQ